MPSNNDFVNSLREELLAIEIPNPRGGAPLDYPTYLALSDGERSDDEQDVVDGRVARRLFSCLGYGEGDWEYNRNKRNDRPDYVLRPRNRVAFFWEDKRTLAALDPDSEQVQRYARSIVPLGILFNGTEILAVRHDHGKNSVFLRVNLTDVYEELGETPLDFVRDDARGKLKLFYELFNRSRFANFHERISSLRIDEAKWSEQALEVTQYLDSFIDGAQNVIERLAYMAHSRLEHVEKRAAQSNESLSDYRSKWRNRVERAKGYLSDDDPDPVEFSTISETLLSKLGYIHTSELESFCSFMPTQDIALSLFEDLQQINDHACYHYLDNELDRSIHSRYLHWKEMQRRFEDKAKISESLQESDVDAKQEEREFKRRWKFAQQSAYVFFLKLLLIRILEDKGILKPRLISDGGLDRWIDVMHPHFEEEEAFAAKHLLGIALERASNHYGGLIQQEVYDWFMPDDISILDSLELLSQYNYSDLSTDLIGYVYQKFLNKTDRHRIGHYLTPPEVVDYILDDAGYSDSNEEAVGKKVLDPACGSGSFLVHAANRYRKLLEAYHKQRCGNSDEWREAIAWDFLKAIQEQFVGMDLNPFSCYLARINLLIQVLNDYFYLLEAGLNPTIRGFRIYNTDSLVDYVLEDELEADVNSDEVRHLKSRERASFGFIFANPPYISLKREEIGITGHRSSPFFQGWLSGDINTYLLFMRVGFHFLDDAGTLSFIIPLTALGDQQSEAMRRKLLESSISVAVTRFYTEHVLFKGIDQAVTVVTFKKRAPTIEGIERPMISGGGYGDTPAEAIEDTYGRPSFKAPMSLVSWWISKSMVPQRGQELPSQSQNWENIWVILPQDRRYYRIWKMINRNSEMTLAQLIRSLGIDPEDDLHQGDVNTTAVQPFHVAEDSNDALPLYKGDLIRLLEPLEYPPRHGPAGRLPFVAARNRDELSGTQRRAFRSLESLASIQENRYGLVLHETAKTRVWRRLKGTVFERNTDFCPVFTHKLWVLETPDRDMALGLLGLLISAPLNFAYACLSTNNSIASRLLLALPVRSDFNQIKGDLVNDVKSGMAASTKLRRMCSQYDGETQIEANYREGTAELDPIAVMDECGMTAIEIEHYLQRGYFVMRREDHKMKTLLRNEDIEFNSSATNEYVIRLWIKQYGDCRWNEFKDVRVPDSPNHFWSEWVKCLHEANRYLHDYFESVKRIDRTVADWYGIPDSMRSLLQEKLPWTHGADED